MELLDAISLDDDELIISEGDDIPKELDETSMMELEELSASCSLDEDSLTIGA